VDTIKSRDYAYDCAKLAKLVPRTSYVIVDIGSRLRDLTLKVLYDIGILNCQLRNLL